MNVNQECTKTKLDDEELEGAGDLIDEDLDFQGQAVLVAGAAIGAGNGLSPELALGKGGGGCLEGVGDGVEVGLELVGGICLLSEGGVVGVKSGSCVCFKLWLVSNKVRVETEDGGERKTYSCSRCAGEQGRSADRSDQPGSRSGAPR